MKFSTVILTSCLAVAPALSRAQEAFNAELVGHAVMPAQTYIFAPKDAPANLQTSGKFTTGKRVEKQVALKGLLLTGQQVFSYRSKVSPFKVTQA